MKKSIAVLSSLALATCAFAVPASSFASKKNSCVTLYEHINFKGRHLTFCSNDSTLVNNKDSHLQFGKKNWNDVASSAKVSSGDGVVLYEHINYKGHKWKLKPGKYADFTKKKLGNGSWNDVVSSLRIR